MHLYTLRLHLSYRFYFMEKEHILILEYYNIEEKKKIKLLQPH